MATFPYPYEGNPEDLLDGTVEIPIDESVPFASSFRQLLEEGTAWAPQTTPQSKLATRLHFAGWSRSQLIEFGLNPKNVENFKRNKGLTGQQAGRPVQGRASAPVRRNFAALQGSELDISAVLANKTKRAPKEMLADALKHKQSIQDTLDKAVKAREDLEVSIRSLRESMELADSIIELIENKISEGHTEE